MKQSNSQEKSEQNKLDLYFKELQNERYEQTFQFSADWLKSVSLNQSQIKPERKKKIIKNLIEQIVQNKLKLAYTFIILVILVAACNYPVTQEETAGDIMQWTIRKDMTESINKIQDLNWFKSGEYNINENNFNGESYMTYSFVVPKEDHSKVKEYERQLSQIGGIMEVKLSPISEKVKRPVYSALLNNFFKININATDMSDDELSTEIDKQLKSAGIEAATIDFERDSEGHRRVKLVVPADQIKKDGGFDLTVKDGKDVNRFKEVRKEGHNGDKFKNKTDEEIRNMVREDIGNKDIKDNEIEIIRKDDRVMVKVNKADSKIQDEIEMNSRYSR